MKLSFPRALMAAALLAAGVVSSAHADIIEIDGANVKFFYDSDVWGDYTATVTGNSISFALADFDLTAKVSTKTGGSLAAQGLGGEPAFYAVAKSGYAVNAWVNASTSGSYSLAASGGSAGGSLSGAIWGGTYSGGAFSGGTYLGEYDNYATLTSTGTATAGALVINTGGGAGPAYGALAIDTYLNAFATQSGKGITNTTLNTADFTFTVTAVPEPETYAMMIAGIGLVGFAARRRKNAA
jgi:hypothetical protein